MGLDLLFLFHHGKRKGENALKFTPCANNIAAPIRYLVNPGIFIVEWPCEGGATSFKQLQPFVRAAYYLCILNPGEPA